MPKIDLGRNARLVIGPYEAPRLIVELDRAEWVQIDGRYCISVPVGPVILTESADSKRVLA